MVMKPTMTRVLTSLLTCRDAEEKDESHFLTFFLDQSSFGTYQPPSSHHLTPHRWARQMVQPLAGIDRRIVQENGMPIGFFNTFDFENLREVSLGVFPHAKARMGGIKTALVAARAHFKHDTRPLTCRVGKNHHPMQRICYRLGFQLVKEIPGQLLMVLSSWQVSQSAAGPLYFRFGVN